jgi:hypothetical protein
MKLVLFVLKNKEKESRKRKERKQLETYPRNFLRLLHLGYDRNSKQHHGNKD